MDEDVFSSTRLTMKEKGRTNEGEDNENGKWNEKALHGGGSFSVAFSRAHLNGGQRRTVEGRTAIESSGSIIDLLDQNFRAIKIFATVRL